MVAVSTNYALPYPTGGDRPCDSWVTWQALGNRLDGVLTALNGDLDRTARTVPMAKVSTDTPQRLVLTGQGFQQVTFDAVGVDTDGMVDLASAPQVITPKRSGIWRIEFSATWDPMTVTPPYVMGAYMMQSGGVVSGSDTIYDANWSAADAGGMGGGLVRVNLAGGGLYAYGVRVSVAAGSSGQYPNVTHATLSMIWQADL